MKMNPEKYAIEKASKMSKDEKMSFVGEKSIRHYGCYGCHNIDGFMDAKPIGVEITQEGSKPLISSILVFITTYPTQYMTGSKINCVHLGFTTEVKKVNH